MPPEPTILAFDTSAAHCAAALLLGSRVVASVREEMVRGQAERLMPLLAELLAAQGLDWSAPDAIGVGIGPGNFTGIRIAVAAARGLALARAIPAIGVNTLEAQAHGTGGVVVSSLDARRDALYVQVFGVPAAAPVLCTLDSLPPVPAGGAPVCIGHRAAEIAAFVGGREAAPAYPLADAIGLIAAGRIGMPHSRPAPLYLRPPDAAPRRDAPVVLR